MHKSIKGLIVSLILVKILDQSHLDLVYSRHSLPFVVSYLKSLSFLKEKLLNLTGNCSNLDLVLK